MRRSTPWRGFESILCAVDFSEHAALALQYAAAVARRGGAPLTTLHVADPLLTAAASAALNDREAVERSERELRRFTDAYLADDATGQVRRLERVVVGAPADEILNTADATGSDLIVVGTSGLTGARRLIMGSTTLSVLERSTVPVLAIPRTTEPGALPARTWPGDLVVLAAEIDEATPLELAAAADVAAWFSAMLLIVHVAGAPAEWNWLNAPIGAPGPPGATVRESPLDAVVRTIRTDVRTRVEVVPGEIGHEIAQIARREAAGLVITMLRDRQGWFGAPRGSVSYDVLTQSPVPVLALPLKDWRTI